MNLIKKFNILTIFFLMFLFSILGKVDCFADDCNMGRRPDGIYPMHNTDIQMVREDIHVYAEEGKTVCKFEFKNTGKANDILMGFPAEQKKTGDLDEKENLTIHDFKTFVQDKEIPVTIEKGVSSEKLNDREKSKYNSWYVFKIHFNENETKIIKNTYKFTSSIYSTGEVYLGYILDTGAYWKGNIGYAKVYFDMGNIKPYQIRSEYTSLDKLSFDGNNLVFERKNFEPNFNLDFYYNVRNYSKEFIDSMGNDYKKQIDEDIKYFNNIEECVNSKNKDKLSYYYKDVENTKLDVVTMKKYISSALLKDTVSDNKTEKEIKHESNDDTDKGIDNKTNNDTDKTNKSETKNDDKNKDEDKLKEKEDVSVSSNNINTEANKKVKGNNNGYYVVIILLVVIALILLVKKIYKAHKNNK